MSAPVITVWRITKARLARHAFDGQGARRFGGRWNSKGTPMVYTAGSQALAVLEMLVHLQDAGLLEHYRFIPVTIDQELVQEMDLAILPKNWNRRPAPLVTAAIGDAWIAAGASPVLRVPSVVIPNEYNYLLNPAHHDFAKLRIGKPVGYRMDVRLR